MLEMLSSVASARTRLKRRSTHHSVQADTCLPADRGGDTLFTRVGLKVVPKPGQLLFFGYKLRDEGSPTGWAAAMDNGVTEHSGCPLREGRKWIATMWFREGVSAERPWDSLRDL